MEGDRQNSESGEKKGKKTVVPYLLYREMVCALLALIVVLIVSLTVDAPLEGRANPSLTPNPAKAPWFFLPVQELLVYFDAWIAGFLLPLILILALITLPYLDFNREGSKSYAFSKRRIAILSFSSVLLVWFLLLFVAFFCRCEHWQFRLRIPFQKLEETGIEKVVPQVYSFITLSSEKDILPQNARSVVSVSIAQNGFFIYLLVWAGIFLFVFGMPLLVILIFKRELGITRVANFIKAYILSLYMWIFVLVLLKIYFYWMTNLKYFLVTEWVNI